MEKTTAQRWERNHGLPVRRLPGIRGRVIAQGLDLDLWLAKNAHLRGGESPKGRPWTRRTVVALVLALAVSLGGFHLLQPARRPASYRVEGSVLIVLGDDGTQLWHHTFPFFLDRGGYASAPHHKCIFVDLDSDGSTEVVFAVKPQALKAGRERIAAFSSRGEVIWEFDVGRKVRPIGGPELHPPYIINRLVEVRRFGSHPLIAVISNHHWSYPSQLGVLDGAGKLVGEYLHAGHLVALEGLDVTGDKADEILAAGVNDDDEVNRATLLVFEATRVSGSSRRLDGSPHFLERGPATELANVVFAKSKYCLGSEFNIANSILPNADGFAVAVTECSPLGLIYDFSTHLALKGVQPNQDLIDQSAMLNGTLGHRLSLKEEVARLRDSIQISLSTATTNGR